MNELVLVDAPFTEIGDDVTVDYDGQVRCHSFEDFRLKFTHYSVGNRVTIMSGASVAMCHAGDGAVLRPGSLSWKGSNLEPGTVYEGAPAAAVDDLERGVAGTGPTLLQGKAKLPVVKKWDQSEIRVRSEWESEIKLEHSLHLLTV